MGGRGAGYDRLGYSPGRSSSGIAHHAIAGRGSDTQPSPPAGRYGAAQPGRGRAYDGVERGRGDGLYDSARDYDSDSARPARDAAGPPSDPMPRGVHGVGDIEARLHALQHILQSSRDVA